jgi:hypothetical protein
MTVEQVDRDAAADLIERYWSGANASMMKLAASYRAGHSHGAFVRAFEAHRIAAEARGMEKAAKIADQLHCGEGVFEQLYDGNVGQAIRAALNGGQHE